MHGLCMATKTISLELDAYEKLRRARRRSGESFSSVVRRARWDDAPPTAGQLLEDLSTLVAQHPEILLEAKVLNRMARRRRSARTKSAWGR